MSLTVARWVFQSNQARSLEENERWWRECYLPTGADAVIQSQPHWRIIVGGTGCGKSIALVALERQACEHALILRYTPEYWPHGKKVLKKDGNHLSQLMALAGFTIRHTPAITLDRIIALPRFQREFLRWLMDKFGGPRTYIRWVQSLGASDDDSRVIVPFEDLYATETEFLDGQGQIEDLIALIRQWGYTQVLVLIDTSNLTGEQLNELSDLGSLFDWLELMHHDGLAIVTTVIPEVLEQGDLVRRARGRVSVTKLHWTQEQVHTLANRHIIAATNQQISSLEHLTNPNLVQQLEAMIEAEHGMPAPQGWVALAELLLDFALQSGVPLKATFDDIRLAYFARFMQLRLDKTSSHRGVWRGPKFIALDEQPLHLIEALVQKRGMPVSSEDLGRVIGMSKGKSKLANLHTLARRVREAIEPDPAKPIYLRNKRDEGYWLENLARDPSV